MSFSLGKQKAALIMTDLDQLNDFLIKLGNAKIGVRRKIVLLQRYIDSAKKKAHEDCNGSKRHPSRVSGD